MDLHHEMHDKVLSPAPLKRYYRSIGGCPGHDFQEAGRLVIMMLGTMRKQLWCTSTNALETLKYRGGP